MSMNNHVVSFDPNSENVIVKCGVLMKNEVFERFKDDILRQYDSGIVTIPAFCEVYVIPKGKKIIVHNYEGDNL